MPVSCESRRPTIHQGDHSHNWLSVGIGSFKWRYLGIILSHQCSLILDYHQPSAARINIPLINSIPLAQKLHSTYNVIANRNLDIRCGACLHWWENICRSTPSWWKDGNYIASLHNEVVCIVLCYYINSVFLHQSLGLAGCHVDCWNSTTWLPLFCACVYQSHLPQFFRH